MRLPLQTLLALCVAFLFTTGAFAQAVVTISDAPAADIPDDGYIGILDGNDGTGTDAGMACSNLDFSGEPASTVLDTWLEIGITHTWLGDLTVKVKSPDGSILPVLVRAEGDNVGSNPPADDGEGCCGDSSDLDSTPITFVDGGATDAEAMGATITDTDFVCTTDGLCEYAPNPDVATGEPNYITNFAGFNGETANGVWEVCVGDGAAADTGTFDTVSFSIEGSAFVSNEPGAELPTGYTVSSAYPNPFNPETQFVVELAETQNVTATVYNALGQEVAVIYDGLLNAGQANRLTFEASDLPSGLYMVHIVGEEFNATRSVSLLK